MRRAEKMRGSEEEEEMSETCQDQHNETEDLQVLSHKVAIILISTGRQKLLQTS
jgi:hypothetical protein